MLERRSPYSTVHPLNVLAAMKANLRADGTVDLAATQRGFALFNGPQAERWRRAVSLLLSAQAISERDGEYRVN